MEVMYYKFFLIICLVEIVICVSKERSNFSAINASIFISNIIAFFLFIIKVHDLGDAIECIIIGGIILILNIILLINKEKIIQERTIKQNETSFIKSATITLVCNMIILIVIPQSYLNKGNKFVIEYLKNKYGNNNYKIINTYEDYCYDGIISSNLCGYYFEVKSDVMKNTFVIETDDKFTKTKSDLFIPVYYSQKYNLNYTLECTGYTCHTNFEELENYIKSSIKGEYKYLTENRNINIKKLYFNSYYELFSNDYGKIPTFEELIISLLNYST